MITSSFINSIINSIINSRYFLPTMALSMLAALIFVNTRLSNETIAWMEKESELYKSKKYLKYGMFFIVRWMCMIVFFNSGKNIYNTIKAWRENGKISF